MANGIRKDIVWNGHEIKTPPFSKNARVEAGVLLSRLQEGESLGMPHSRPMPMIGAGCHELRVRDETKTWRIFYFVDTAIVILDMLQKATRATPARTIKQCRKVLARYLDSKNA